MEDYDYENAADKNDYCPGVEDDDYGGDFNDADNIDTSFDADSQNRYGSHKNDNNCEQILEQNYFKIIWHIK